MADSEAQSAPLYQAARDSCADKEQELSAVHSRLAALEQAHQELLDQYVLAEERCNELTAFQVACERLSSAVRHEEAVAAISEIAIDLIGAECFAIFELDQSRSVLRPVSSQGVEPEQLEKIPATDDLLSAPYIAASDRPERRLTAEHRLIAMIPLHLGTRVTGALAIFGLYPQKLGLSQSDVHLLQLISTHAAHALYQAELEEKRALRSTAC
jgi:GAF domain-containing protein